MPATTSIDVGRIGCAVLHFNCSFLLKQQLPARHNSSEHTPCLDDSALDAAMPLPVLTSRSLPLVYVNVRDFRVFVPVVECSADE